jgi:arylsulfatase A-like enzyme
MLAFAGVPIPPAMQGGDLSSALRGDGAGPASAFLQQFVPYRSDNVPEGWRGVRTSRYLYARTETEPWLLYDLQADPYQQRNLVADPASAPLRSDLEAKLSDWMKRTGDSWSFNTRQPVDDKGRLFRFGTFTTVDEYLKWAEAHPDLAPKD